MEWEPWDQHLDGDVQRGHDNEGAHGDRELRKEKAEGHSDSWGTLTFSEQKKPSKDTEKKQLEKEESG